MESTTECTYLSVGSSKPFKAQCVVSSGLALKSPAFCPFVSLCSINHMVFLIEAHRILCKLGSVSVGLYKMRSVK